MGGGDDRTNNRVRDRHNDRDLGRGKREWEREEGEPLASGD